MGLERTPVPPGREGDGMAPGIPGVKAPELLALETASGAPPNGQAAAAPAAAVGEQRGVSAPAEA